MTPLIKKLGIHKGQRIWLLNCPKHVSKEILSVDGLTPYDGEGEADYIHIFAAEEVALIDALEDALQFLAPQGMCWVSWPKKSAGVSGDLDREKVRFILLQTTLVDIKVCSVDETWSALKFVHRRKPRV